VPVAFPDEDLDVRIEAAFGADLTQPPSTWTWTDLTDRLLPNTITIRRGVAVGAAAAQVSSGNLVLRNDDGALTPQLATSPYWPNVDAGTPVRIRMRTEADPFIVDTFTRTVATGWGTPDVGPVWFTDFPSALAVTGGRGTISYSSVNTIKGAEITSVTDARDVEVTLDAAVSATASGIANPVGPMLRYDGALTFIWPTVEFLTTGGVQLKTWVCIGGSLSVLSQASVPGVTYTAGTLVRLKAQVSGDQIRSKAWLPAGAEPANWQLEVTDTRITAGGGIGVQTLMFGANTNTMPFTFSVDNVTYERSLQTRLEGYLSDVKPTFRPEGGGRTWSEVAIEIGGVGSRLEKMESPAYSPMRRSIQLSTVPPIGYWPLEDGEGATYGVSAFPGGPKMTVNGPLTFGYSAGIPAEQYLTRYGTRPLVSVATGARLTASVPVSQVNSQWAIDITNQMFVPEVPSISEIRILQWQTPGGTHQVWYFVGTDLGYDIRAYNLTTLVTTTIISTNTGSYDQMMTWEIDATQSGANVVVNLYVNSAFFATGTLVGSTLSAVSKIVVNPDRSNTTASVTPRGLRFVVGHVRVSDNTGGTGIPYYYDNDRGPLLLRADLAWYQESAHKRILRLCQEENIPCAVVGTISVDSSGYTALGAQQDGSFTELLAAAAEAESGGLLYESKFGYAFLPRTARYNRRATLIIDLDTYARDGSTDPTTVLVPQLDGRRANSWTVERTDGATGTFAAAASVRARRGTIAQQVTLDVLSDFDTDDHAAWRVHLAVDATGADYPSIAVDLAANPNLIEDYLDCDIGSRVRRDNQPTVAGTGSVEQVIEGVVEQLGPRVWTAELTASPASVWDTAVYNDPLTRYDTAGCVTTEALDTTETGVDVTTTSGPPWAPTSLLPAAVPFDVSIGGERMTVTNVAGTGNAQTLTVTRSVNGIVKTHATGASVGLADRFCYGL
jgi:hypothetical protein